MQNIFAKRKKLRVCNTIFIAYNIAKITFNYIVFVNAILDTNIVDIFDNLFAVGYFESKKFWDILTISEIGITIYIIDDYVPKISDNIIFIPFTNISYISTIKHNDLNVMRQHYVEKNNQKK